MGESAGHTALKKSNTATSQRSALKLINLAQPIRWENPKGPEAILASQYSLKQYWTWNP